MVHCVVMLTHCLRHTSVTLTMMVIMIIMKVLMIS